MSLSPRTRCPRVCSGSELAVALVPFASDAYIPTSLAQPRRDVLFALAFANASFEHERGGVSPRGDAPAGAGHARRGWEPRAALLQLSLADDGGAGSPPLRLTAAREWCVSASRVVVVCCCCLVRA